MNSLILHPSDVLFFRDGRPMDGSSTGSGAAWPLPTVLNAALHSALHRAKLKGVHDHRRGRSLNRPEDADRDRKFGCLLSVGPFPVKIIDDKQAWYFPRPLDADENKQAESSLLPLKINDSSTSSLPDPLVHPVANTQIPNKDTPHSWWDKTAWDHYLGNENKKLADYKNDSCFSNTEYQIGIGIDPTTSTQNKEQFYSAHYLRLKPSWNLGMLAIAMDKENNDPNTKRDLIPLLINENNRIIAGGQQRICSIKLDQDTNIPLPKGKSIFVATEVEEVEKYLVKWTLLTPAIYPILEGKNEHPGAWLPTWVDTDGNVQLLNGPGKNAAKRKKLTEGTRINAKLVSALTGKPITVTGYSLGHGVDKNLTTNTVRARPKPTHLAVPAGSVYFFECSSSEDATDLAHALNWHGTSAGTEILNRRSTIFGEKGFGLGVCSPWQFHSGIRPEIS